MTHLVFGGTNGIGKRCLKLINKKYNEDSLNIDLTNNNSTLNKSIVGDLTSNIFRHELYQKLKNIKIESITWSIRSRSKKEQSSQILQDCMAVEIYPLMELIEFLGNEICRQNAKIVIISSIASEFVSAQDAAYNITKSAIETYVKCMAVKFGKISEARINVIRAGIVSMPERSNINQSKNNTKKLEKASIPRLVPINAEEIAKLNLFLISNDSSALNGSIINADGGESLLDQYFVAQSMQEV